MLENPGSIGLSIMAALYEWYLQRIEHISIKQAPQKLSKGLLIIIKENLTIEKNHYSF